MYGSRVSSFDDRHVEMSVQPTVYMYLGSAAVLLAILNIKMIILVFKSNSIKNLKKKSFLVRNSVFNFSSIKYHYSFCCFYRGLKVLETLILYCYILQAHLGVVSEESVLKLALHHGKLLDC